MTLHEQLNSLYTANSRYVLLLETLFVPVKFKKGSFLNTQKHSFPILYCIEQGLAIGYYEYIGKSYCTWVLDCGFLLPSAGLFSRNATAEHIEFLEETTGWSLNLVKAEALVKKEPLMYRLLLEIFEDSLMNSKNRELMLRLKTADERFEFIQLTQHNLVYRMMNAVAAAILNVSDKYLYKVKRKNRKK